MNWIRPSSNESEKDLLALQQEFLATKQTPAARVCSVQVSEKSREVRRDEEDDGKTNTGIRVATTSGPRHSVPGLLIPESPALGTPVVLVLRDVQERVEPGSPHSCPLFHTEQGFPIARKLQIVPTPAKKKSLFAQQFDQSQLAGYGLQRKLPSGSDKRVIRDRMELPHSFPTTEDHMAKQDSKLAVVQESDSTSDSSHDADRFQHLKLVSGQGLVSAGLSPASASQEVLKIHQNNVQQLSLLSEKEIREEQCRIRAALGPGLTSFLTRKKQPAEAVPSASEKSALANDTGSEEDALVRDTHSKEAGLSGDKWVNMDVVERDKLEWMTDVTMKASNFSQHREIRFSLDALIIPWDVGISIPTHLALHHHGEEPGSAGYTLAELLLLARSSAPQQRVLALQTLAMLITRARHSEYLCAEPKGPDLSSLLVSGQLPLLLRCSLDESGTSIQVAALNCLHCLLISSPEEQLLDEQSSSFLGLSQPALSPQRRSKVGVLTMQDTDIEVMEKDVVKGLLRMQLLPRLRYLMEVCQPPVSVKVLMLELLGRICRHSVEAASQVANCPRLINTIMTTSLPADWAADDSDTHPIPQAMKLIRLICAASKHVATELVEGRVVLAAVLRHGVTAPLQLALPSSSSHGLCVEALRTLAVLLRHGQTCKTIRDVFPQLLTFIHHPPSTHLSKWEQLRIITLWQLMEAVVHCTMNLHPNKLSQVAALDWTHVHSLIEPALRWLSVCVKECSEGDQFHLMCVLGNVASVLTAILTAVQDKPQLLTSTTEAIELADRVSSEILPALLSSNFCSVAVHSFCVSLEAVQHALPAHSPPTLPAHFTPSPSAVKPAVYGKPHMTAEDYPRLTQTFSELGSSSGLLLAVVRLGLSLLQLHQNVAGYVFTVLDLGRVLRLLLTLPQVQAPCMITVHLLLFNILRLGTSTLHQSVTSTGPQDPSTTSSVPSFPLDLIHKSSLCMTVLFPAGFEYCLFFLLSSVVFLPSFYTREVDHYLNSLQLWNPPSSVADSSSVILPPQALLREAVRSLPSIQSTYLDHFSAVLTEKAVVRSRELLTGQPGGAVSLLLPPSSGPLLPRDWIFLPVISQYTQTLQGSPSEEESEDIVPIINSLRFLLLSEQTSPLLLAGVSLTMRLAHVMCVFLAGSGLFLEEHVHKYLSALLHWYSSPRMLQSLDLSEAMPGLVSFSDLYSSLLDHFVAVSYGDHLFASYLSLPLQQQHNSCFRKILWNDYPTIFRIFSLPLTQVPGSLSAYLYPEEQDPVLLGLYMNTLGTGSVRPEWSPLLFLVAVHHIHSFLFSCNSEEGKHPLRKMLLEGALQLSNKTLQCQLLLYSGHTHNGLQLAPALSDHQRKIISLYRPNEDFQI